MINSDLTSKTLLKSAVLILASICMTGRIFAQHVPDPDSSSPSTSHYYYENLGQVTDDTGGLRPGIKYYTELTSPAIWLSDDRVSYSLFKKGDSLVADSSFRIDMQFACMGWEYFGACGNIQAYEQSSDHLNFYQPHCGSGITDVHGYAGVMYQNAFNNTDAHFYSNDQGPKTYFVFRPGADTGDFMLHFIGQDSISSLGSTLQLYVGAIGVTFPFATAYQVGPSGSIIPLTWQPQWVDMGGGFVKMIFGPYNTSQDLVVKIGFPSGKATAASDNLVWCTYYGAGGTETAPIIKSSSNGVHHVMGISGAKFPINFGSTLPPSPFGGFDCYLSQFNQNGERLWATYYGGSDDEFPYDMSQLVETGHDLGDLLICGSTKSSDLRLTNTSSTSSPGYKKTSYGGSVDGFISSFNGNSGELVYGTHYGGSGLDVVTSINADLTGHKIYFAGTTGSSTIDVTSPNPTGNAISLRNPGGTSYYQSTFNGSGSRYGLIGRFDMDTRDLEWATFLGGNNESSFFHVLFDDKSGSDGVYAVGSTRSSSQLPLTNSTGTAYYQTTIHNTANTEGLITHFNSSLHLDWCTYFGGDGVEELWRSALNSTGQFFVSGSTFASDPEQSNSDIENTSGLLPVYSNGTAYSQGPGDGSTSGNAQGDGLVAEFSLSHHLLWSTYYGGSGDEVSTFSTDGMRRTCEVAVDGSNTVYLAGFGRMESPSSGLGNVPTLGVPGRYNQLKNASDHTSNNAGVSHDGWIAQFRSDNSLKWATQFGGITTNNGGGDPDPREMINSISVDNHNGTVDLYMTGITFNDKTPTDKAQRCPYATSFCDDSYNRNRDVFIGKFVDAHNTDVSAVNASGSNSVIVVPNPSGGIYEILYSNSQTGIRTASVAVYNQLGQLVAKSDFPAIHGQNRYRIDLGNMAAGIYILRIQAGDKIDVCRLSKY